MNLRIDPDRAAEEMQSGIYVRTQDMHGRWHSADITALDRESLLDWLRTAPDLAERVVLLLLGHDVPTLGDPGSAAKEGASQ